jgi:hypothetical protein
MIDDYREGPAVLRRAWETVPDAARKWSPEPGAWSAHQIIIHCADSETYAAIRIRLLAAEPRPLIVGYDQDTWTNVFSYHDQSVDDAFAVIEAVRAHTASIIRAQGEALWDRVGEHTESGTYSARDWLSIYSAHLHDHAVQIANNHQRWLGRGGAGPS